MMRILFFTSDNSFSSGAFRSMAQLCAGLKEEGYKIKVILPFDGDGILLLNKYQIDYEIIRSYSWIVPKNSFRVLGKVIGLYGIFYNKMYSENLIKEEILSYKPDAIHINGTWHYIGAKVAIELKIPIVWHIREFLEEDQNRKIIFRKKGYHMISQAQRIICISQAVFSKYKNIFPVEKMQVIYNGINMKEYYQQKHEIFEGKNVRILCAGGISKNKGQYDAIKAVALLNDSRIILDIVGGASKYNALKIKLYLRMYHRNNVSINYWGRQKDMRKFYENADIYLMTSKSEAWGRVTAEAMAAGCLVIGADSGATPELLINDVTGVLYLSGDHVEMAQKINASMCNIIRSKEIASAGRSYALNNWGVERNLYSINSLYESLEQNI